MLMPRYWRAAAAVYASALARYFRAASSRRDACRKETIRDARCLSLILFPIERAQVAFISEMLSPRRRAHAPRHITMANTTYPPPCLFRSLYRQIFSSRFFDDIDMIIIITSFRCHILLMLMSDIIFRRAPPLCVAAI
jgi:hypothetical protein